MCRLFVILAILPILVRWGLADAAQPQDSKIPEQLQGRESYWIQEKPFLSKAAITAKLIRPRNARELLRNLHDVWIDRLLVEPNFYNDSILMACFASTAVTWKDMLVDPAGDQSNRVAELKLENRLFPKMVVRLQLSRDKEAATNKPLRYFPEHQHYIGSLDLSTEGVTDLTWEEVTQIFGRNATSLPLMISSAPGAVGAVGSVRSDIVALMRYSYPGDDPAKFGYLELPQTKISLSGRRPDVPLSQREEPLGSDKVTRIFMLEAINHVRGEE